MLRFVSSLVESLAWPLVVVILALIFRTPLAELLSTLKRVRYRDTEIDFSGELQKLGGEAKTAGLQIPEEPSESNIGRTTADSLESATHLVSEFPGPAIGVAWLAVEYELAQAVKRAAIPTSPSRKSALPNIDTLQKHGYLNTDTASVLHRMRRLRNAVVHATPAPASVSADEAREFIRLAGAVTAKLKAIEVS